jgi:hypothetical protein
MIIAYDKKFLIIFFMKLNIFIFVYFISSFYQLFILIHRKNN